jgi:betaine reductase
MMARDAAKIRILHFLNPFFAGLGGEEANDRGPEVQEGSRGPGRAVDQLLGTAGKVVATLICGDNFFSGHEVEVLAALEKAAVTYQIELVLAGPAFNAGRYGWACGAICQAAAERLHLPAVTAMSPENPGAAFRRQRVYIIPTGNSVRSMGEVLPRLLGLGLKLARQEPAAPAEEEGYLPRGLRFNERAGKTGAQRSVDMLLAKMRGEPFQTEIALEAYDAVSPAPPLTSLTDAVIGLATEMGLIPPGNPDRIPSARSKVWGRYSIASLDRLSPGQFSYVHGGYDTRRADQDPNRAVPLDALRAMEREGRFRHLLDEVLSTCGNGGALEDMKRIGREMATEARQQGVTGVVLPAS